MMIAICVFVLAASQAANAGILDSLGWARSDKMEVTIPWLPFENESRCYDELGCLNITRSWYHLIHRPFNVFPLPRSVINTRFILYTRLNPTEGQILRPQDEKTIKKSKFDPKKKSKFIIHGFIDTPLSNWVGDMRDELIKADDMNIFVVDWAGGSLPLYTQATANTRLVGLELGYFINYLIKNYNVEASDVHIIGHSLGAHTAGYAGALVPGLGRITGLDPAEPYFQNMPAHVRLDPTDAELVDVIHTDGKGIFFLGYGMSQPCGHLDFYPNNGKEQPGCDITQTPLVPLTLIREGLEEASRVLVACNHVRAIKLFIESINGQCPYLAHQCPSYQHFVSGKCFKCKPGSTDCALMGYHADLSPGLENEISPRLQDNVGNKFFTTTGRELPFCHRLYRISLELAKPTTAETWVQGFIKASLHSPQGVVNLDLTPSGDMKLEHGSTYSMVLSHPADLGGNIKRMELNWEYDMNVLEPRTLCLFWCNDHLYVKSVSVEELEMPSRGKRDAQFSSKLCSRNKRDYADIANRGRAIFLDSCKPPQNQSLEIS
ncbi:PREDICTED: pancreatic triacylglycerol lipase-like [Nicrophorus vespilloides]|uniref:Pancreatic triacylglycerol lipase-like n=1 Tax=Nicrophorus vespilloides TaxID=110193 RepID=A0ABM1NBW0_NICVS|nr:PREDICTED: pancreatic triacylglycerol lipase-like [Nicrophorus vespilloides]